MCGSFYVFFVCERPDLFVFNLGDGTVIPSEKPFFSYRYENSGTVCFCFHFCESLGLSQPTFLQFNVTVNVSNSVSYHVTSTVVIVFDPTRMSLSVCVFCFFHSSTTIVLPQAASIATAALEIATPILVTFFSVMLMIGLVAYHRWYFKRRDVEVCLPNADGKKRRKKTHVIDGCLSHAAGGRLSFCRARVQAQRQPLAAVQPFDFLDLQLSAQASHLRRHRLQLEPLTYLFFFFFFFFFIFLTYKFIPFQTALPNRPR
jgi:hypothetical protein